LESLEEDETERCLLNSGGLGIPLCVVFDGWALKVVEAPVLDLGLEFVVAAVVETLLCFGELDPFSPSCIGCLGEVLSTAPVDLKYNCSCA
jgi:hypothetical protein